MFRLTSRQVSTASAWLAFTALSVLTAAYILAERRTHFNHAVWYANTLPESFDCPRALMANDLIRNQLKRGMPRSQARTLLGRPDASSQVRWTPTGFVTSHADAYSLGFIGKAKDISTLELHYSDDGQLVSAKVVKR